MKTLSVLFRRKRNSGLGVGVTGMGKRPVRRKIARGFLRFLSFIIWAPVLVALFLLFDLFFLEQLTPSNPIAISFKVIALLAIFTAFVLILDRLSAAEVQEEAVADACLSDTETQELDALTACYRKCNTCPLLNECIPGGDRGPICENSDIICKLEAARKKS